MLYAVHEETKVHRAVDDIMDVNRVAEWVAEADGEGWIAWEGCSCPLPEGARCDFVLIDGLQVVGASIEATELQWGRSGNGNDIAFYRPILDDPAPAAPSPRTPLTYSQVFDATHKAVGGNGTHVVSLRVKAGSILLIDVFERRVPEYKSPLRHSGVVYLDGQHGLTHMRNVVEGVRLAVAEGAKRVVQGDIYRVLQDADEDLTDGQSEGLAEVLYEAGYRKSGGGEE